MSTNHSILIVDDDPKLRRTLSDIFRAKGYAPITAATGKEALDRVEEEAPAVALIDLRLEDMSGLKVMGEIRERSPGTECIVLTGYASQASAIEAVNLGAYSYVQKPYDMEQLLVTVRRAVEKREAEESLRESEQRYRQLFESIGDAVIVYSSQGRFVDCNQAALQRLGYSREEFLHLGAADIVHPDFHQVMKDNQQRIWAGESTVVESAHRCKDGRVIPVEVNARRIEYQGEPAILAVVRDITERKRAEEELQQSLEQLRRAFEGTVNVLGSAIEMRDPYTAGHQRRVTQLARAIANETGLPEQQIEGIRMAGLIHDLGKITVPAEILSKPGGLSDLEYGLIQAHSQVGYDALKEFDFPWPVAQIVLQHHERTDGSGYPAGLSGEEIMLEARILAVADVVEAMASHRPYRPPRGLDKALEEISQNRGVLYDPEVVDACLELFTEKGFEFE